MSTPSLVETMAAASEALPVLERLSGDERATRVAAALAALPAPESVADVEQRVRLVALRARHKLLLGPDAAKEAEAELRRAVPCVASAATAVPIVPALTITPTAAAPASILNVDDGAVSPVVATASSAAATTEKVPPLSKEVTAGHAVAAPTTPGAAIAAAGPVADDVPAEDTGDCPTTWGVEAAEAVAKESAPSATAMAGLYQDAEGEAFDAFSYGAWAPGTPCPFGFWTDVLADVSATSGRNTVMRRLAFGLLTLLMRGTVDEVLHALYICLNEVAPAHEGLEIGVGDATLSAVVAEVCGLTPARLKAEYQATGDLAEVAQTHKKRQATLVVPKPLTLARVFTSFKNIALTSGKDTQRRRGDAIKVLLRDAVGAEVNFLVRSLQGKMRIGVALNTVLNALGHAYALFSLLPEQQRRPTAPLAAGVKAPAVPWNKKRLSAAALQLLLNAGASAMSVAFHQCPSVDIILKTLSTTEGGFSAPPVAWLPRLGIRPNLPVKPMLAHPTTGVRQLLDRFAGRAFTCEYKYDGERAQVHYVAPPAAAADATSTKPNFSIFSRNSESYTTKFPDVIAALPAAFAPPADGAPAVTSCILDGEVVAVDPETGRIKPFQVLQHRGKKDVNINDVSIAVAYYLFDILLLNGRSLLHLSLRERREIMHTVFRETPSVRFARGSDSSDVEDIQAFLEQSVAEGCEGLMVKTLDVDARYTPFKRSHSWLKLKKDYMEGVGDTLDLVVLGAYRGKGKRTGVYGGFLLACFDAASEEFQSICKVGTGFSDADLEQLTNALEAHVIDSMRADYRVDSGLKADVWFDAHLVFEIRAADLSLSPVHSAAIGLVDPNRGIALRFPRYLKLRDDKAATDATSAEQVAAMYRSQAVVAEDGAPAGAGGDVDDACL